MAYWSKSRKWETLTWEKVPQSVFTGRKRKPVITVADGLIVATRDYQPYSHGKKRREWITAPRSIAIPGGEVLSEEVIGA